MTYHGMQVPSAHVRQFTSKLKACLPGTFHHEKRTGPIGPIWILFGAGRKNPNRLSVNSTSTTKVRP